jgi:hypothetical protein
MGGAEHTSTAALPRLYDGHRRHLRPHIPVVARAADDVTLRDPLVESTAAGAGHIDVLCTDCCPVQPVGMLLLLN